MINNPDEQDAASCREMLEVIEHFQRIAILVVGDVMLDRYWWGSVTRISPEAPVPVVRHERSTLAAGGAANVAANIAGLSGRPLLVGLIGDDEGGRELPLTLNAIGVETGHLISTSERPTTVKTRVVAHGQHVVRVDNEDTSPISQEQAQQVTEHVLSLLPESNVLVISDYAKGLLDSALLQSVIAEARRLGIPVLIDPKGMDYKRYAGATLITPNRLEAAQACGIDATDQRAVETSGHRLLDELEIQSCLITQGEEGMTLFRRDHAPVHLPAMARDVYDVTGAGDTVIAALSLSVGAGADLLTAARLANLSAGLAVEQVGTTVLGLELLREHLESLASTFRLEEQASKQAEHLG
ncbi:MAG: D-glycero-beta-D-manno-heptose-7-phosphate kinase [Pyrinomonadaceae bacterium]|nr:D-glycero-beta-D-manno-heptose-7-phosphate kinase [Pyrinomonadaceae bacterium]